MKTAKITVFTLMSGMFITLMLTTEAETNATTNKIEYTQIQNEDFTQVSAMTILERNKTLLTNSIISHTLKSSSNTKAKTYFSDAEALYQQANSLYKSGKKQEAKDMAVNSILVVIKSVEEHYQPKK